MYLIKDAASLLLSSGLFTVANSEFLVNMYVHVGTK